MKAILEFNLDEPTERLEHKRAVNATSAYIAFWDISNELFRPAFKHGYSALEFEINSAIAKCGEENAIILIGALADKYRQILEQHGIDLNDLD